MDAGMVARISPDLQKSTTRTPVSFPERSRGSAVEEPAFLVDGFPGQGARARKRKWLASGYLGCTHPGGLNLSRSRLIRKIILLKVPSKTARLMKTRHLEPID